MDKGLSIKFCFLVRPDVDRVHEFDVVWPTENLYGTYVMLDDDATQNDVALLIASLLNFSELAFGSGFVQALNADDELALVGGLMFERDGVVIRPSCCADFLDWRDTVDGIKERRPPWMGHDPSPWFEFDGDNITLWDDEPKDGRTLRKITMTQEAFDQELDLAKIQLATFRKRVEDWVDVSEQHDLAGLMDGVSQYLRIR